MKRLCLGLRLGQIDLVRIVKEEQNTLEINEQNRFITDCEGRAKYTRDT